MGTVRLATTPAATKKMKSILGKLKSVDLQNTYMDIFVVVLRCVQARVALTVVHMHSKYNKTVRYHSPTISRLSPFECTRTFLETVLYLKNKWYKL